MRPRWKKGKCLSVFVTGRRTEYIYTNNKRLFFVRSSCCCFCFWSVATTPTWTPNVGEPETGYCIFSPLFYSPILILCGPLPRFAAHICLTTKYNINENREQPQYFRACLPFASSIRSHAAKLLSSSAAMLYKDLSVCVVILVSARVLTLIWPTQ